MDINTLYQQHKNMVYRLALSYVKSIPDAEDVCQSVFLRLMEKGHTIQPGKERAWLAAVTANLSRDHLRRQQHCQTQPLTEALTFSADTQSEIFWAVMALPEAERIPIHLYYYEGCSTAEIAHILHITQTAVTTRLSRARKHLKKQWEDMEL